MHRPTDRGATLCSIVIWPRAAKHEAFSQKKEANSLQLSLKTEIIPSNNLKIVRPAISNQVGKSVQLQRAGVYKSAYLEVISYLDKLVQPSYSLVTRKSDHWLHLWLPKQPLTL